MDAEMGRFATRELGFDPAELQGLVNPRTYRALHKLWSLDRAAAAEASRRRVIAPLPPVARGRSAPASAGLSDKSAVGDWMKARRRQVARG